MGGNSGYEKLNYTQMPNSLLDTHMLDMSEAELKVVLVIARCTSGWHKQKDKLSITQLIKKTGLTRQGVVNGIQDGMDRGVIGRDEDGMGFLYYLIIDDKPVNEVDQSTKLTSQRNRLEPVNEIDHQPVNEIDSQKKDIKESINKGGAPVNPQSSTGDPLMDAAKARFERRQGNGGNFVQDWQLELNKRMPSSERLAMVEVVARLFGLTAKMNSDDKTLRMVHEQSVVLYESGYNTPAKVEALHAVWLTDDWRKKNPDKLTVYKFTDFASLKAQEDKAKSNRQRKEIVIWNQYTNKHETKVVYQ